MVCHMINITGQILPIRAICDMAHSKGVEVMVDGATRLRISSFRCATCIATTTAPVCING
jgi:selenocysteine lyase/cysteine desulfurase